MAFIKTKKKKRTIARKKKKEKRKKKKDMAKMLVQNLAKTVNLEVGTFF